MTSLRTKFVTWWESVGPLAWPIILAAIVIGAVCFKSHRAATKPVHGYDPATGKINLRLLSVPVPVQALSAWSRWERDGIAAFKAKHPDIHFVAASQLKLPGELAEATDVLSFIGDTWPDVFELQDISFSPYVSHGFCLPLDDVARKLGYDLAAQTPPGARDLVIEDGKQYGLIAESWPYGLTYRRDLFEKFGLGRDFKIETWEDLYLAAMVSTRDGIRGIGLFNYGVSGWGDRQFFSFLVSDGGDVMERDSNSQWRVAFDSPAGVAAAKFIRRLQHGRWVRSPQYGWPVSLRLKNGEQACTDLEAKSVDGSTLEAVLPDGRSESWQFDYEKSKLEKGVALNLSGSEASFSIGKTAISLMMPWFDLQNSTSAIGTGGLNLTPSSLGVASMPRGPDYRGPPRSYCEYQVVSVCGLIRDPRQIEAAFKWAAWIAGPENRALRTRAYVQTGSNLAVDPADLREAGYGRYLSEFPAGWVDGLDAVRQSAVAIPAHPKYRQISQSEWELVFSRILRDETASPESLLKDCGHRVREQVLGGLPPDRLYSYRLIACGFVVVLALVVVGGAILFIRKANLKPATLISDSKTRWWPYLLILPAVLLIAFWSYLPLAWGSVMAFLKYSVLGGLQQSQWLGVDNFIYVVSDPYFASYVWNTLLFVGLTLGMTFFAPIILALMLSEIPRGKLFFRLVFYLPAVTTGVVVALMWTEFFRASPEGTLNQLMVLLGMQPVHWLGTPILAMACTIVPGVWASAGPGCLIYLAALKSVPDDLYEAADLDGASLWQKLRSITLPTIMPLIVINFLGTLIGTFHSTGNILLMTGGGPEGTTRVFSFMIWFKAFIELEYGQATAMAWVLGSALIGLMVVQLRLLSRVEFRKAETD